MNLNLSMTSWFLFFLYQTINIDDAELEEEYTKYSLYLESEEGTTAWASE